MECISSAKYQISHDGKEFGRIIPERGIRQGDPLSSYLFLVCMEGLTTLIQDYERRKLLSGIQVARGAPIISHMFFADDTYIFCKARGRMLIKLSSSLIPSRVHHAKKIMKTKPLYFLVITQLNTLSRRFVTFCTSRRLGTILRIWDYRILWEGIKKLSLAI